MHRMLGRLKQCCWLTWVVFVIVSLAMTLIAIPGDPAGPYEYLDGIDRSGWSKQLEEAIERRYSTGDLGTKQRVIVDQYRHGWPLPCITRGIGRVVRRTSGAGLVGRKETFVHGHPRTQPLLSVRLPSDGDSFTSVRTSNRNAFKLVPTDWEETALWWSDYNRWPLASDGAEWHFDYLLFDLAVMLLIPLAAAALTEWWIRRRGGALRFRLFDLMVVFVVCSLAFAWYRSHADLRQIEQGIEANGSPFLFASGSLREGWEDRQQGRPSFNSYRREYFGPDWLRRLFGNREFLRFSKHVVAVQLVPNESWKANLEILPELDHLESVSLPRGATQRVIGQLEKLSQLREVQISVGSHDSQTILGETTDLTGDRWINAQNLVLLQSLSIVELGLMGEDLLVEDIEQIVSMPSLKRLELVDPSLSLPQLERLREKNSHVEIVCGWGQEFWSTASPGRHFSFRETPPRGVDRRIKLIKQRRAAADVADR